MSDDAPDAPATPRANTARHALGGMVWSGVGFGAQGIGQFLVVIVFARVPHPRRTTTSSAPR